MNFRRPELEKDNPIAPQMYIGPRRKLAQLRHASSSRTPVPGTTQEALQTLIEAAERVANILPQSKKTDTARHALLDAIAQAQRLLAAKNAPAE
ncbi:MAG: hypothetical protein ABL970_06100 [Nitrospira sp.]